MVKKLKTKPGFTKSGVKITLNGDTELIQQFEKLSKSLDPKKIEPVFTGAAKIIADYARDKAPAGPTGNLKKSIKVKKWRRKGETVTIVLAAVDRKIAPHAHLLEYGTSRMSARPFWRPAVNAKSLDAEIHFVDGIRDLIAKAAKP